MIKVHAEPFALTEPCPSPPPRDHLNYCDVTESPGITNVPQEVLYLFLEFVIHPIEECHFSALCLRTNSGTNNWGPGIHPTAHLNWVMEVS